MILPLIGFNEVESALHNARVLMNAYLRARINLTEDNEIRFVLSKRTPRFYYEVEEGKKRAITTIVLAHTEKDYVVIYNGKDEEATPLTNLSANELYMLCSILESFWKHIKIDNEAEEDEFQTVD